MDNNNITSDWFRVLGHCQIENIVTLFRHYLNANITDTMINESGSKHRTSTAHSALGV